MTQMIKAKMKKKMTLKQIAGKLNLVILSADKNLEDS
jgi:hypothetical protein